MKKGDQPVEIVDDGICYLPSRKRRPLATYELDADDIAAFCSIGFSQHVEIFTAAKNLDERLYYIHACAKAPWTVEQLQQHLRADDYHNIGALPNNFGKTLSPMELVAVELKMGKFRPSYLGQLELYLSALDATVRHADENPSIGLLLCEKMNKGVVEFAVRDKSKPLGIATYKTLKSIPKPYRSLAPVIEGVRRELANGLKERTKKKGRS